MKVQLSKMLTLQASMNSKVNPNWLTAGNAWHRAIWIECAELVAHHGYKWWKKETPNIPAIQIEIVDIWHFALSMMIESETHRGNGSYDVDDFAQHLSDTITTIRASNIPADAINILDTAEAVAGTAAYGGTADVPGHGFNIGAFVFLLKAAGMSFDDLYKQYVGKNVLNFFRQDHGYKEDTYVKMWDGREDNDHLVDIMETLDVTSETFDKDVYEALEAKYAIYSRVA